MKIVLVNEKIKAPKVRLVTDDNSAIISLQQALDIADELGLDLMQVSDQEIPVVKIVDYNKFCYEQKQAEKDAKKKQRQTATQVKEVQFTYDTQDHDLKTKAKNAIKFLDEGKNVRLVMRMVGRVKTNASLIDLNKESMVSFIGRLGEIDYSQQVMIQGNNITCTIKRK